METYTITKLPDEPIVIFSVTPNHNIATEGQQAIGNVIQVVADQSDPVSLVCDLTDLNVNLSELTIGAALVAFGESPLFHHANIKAVFMVSQDAAVQLASKNLAADVYGNLHVAVVDTLDEALAYVRTK